MEHLIMDSTIVRAHPCAAGTFKKTVDRKSKLLAEDAIGFLQLIIQSGAIPVIPPRKNRIEQRDYDTHLYKERHLVECFINKVKHFRRIFSRFEKLASCFLGFLSFVGTLNWLR